MTPPETRYAKSGELRIAYQVVGGGPLDLVFAPGFVSNIDLDWEMPERAYFFGRLSAFSRLIRFDKRGTGLSDRDVGIASLEERMDDVRAVMDAAGSERAALCGVSEGGAMSILFAATYPQRTRALVLYGSYARPSHLLSDEDFNKEIDRIDRLWGTGEYLTSRYMPRAVPNEIARIERQCASPSAVMAIRRMNREIDARHVLPAIRVPTLIMHRIGDSAISVELGRYLAAWRQICRAAGNRSCPVLRAQHYRSDCRRDRGVPDRVAQRAGRRSSAGDGDVHRHRRLDEARRRTRRPAMARPARPARRHGAATACPLPRAGGQESGRRVHGDVRRPGPCRTLCCLHLRIGAAARHRGAQRPPYR